MEQGEGTHRAGALTLYQAEMGGRSRLLRRRSTGAVVVLGSDCRWGASVARGSSVSAPALLEQLPVQQLQLSPQASAAWSAVPLWAAISGECSAVSIQWLAPLSAGCDGGGTKLASAS